MPDWRRLAVGVGAVGVGAAAGWAVERALLRKRLEPTRQDPELGLIEGEQTTIAGPAGTRLLVESYGPEDGPLVLLSHGFAMTGRCWHEQVVALGDRYRLVTYDQPGHGRSTGPTDRADGRGSRADGRGNRGDGGYSLDLLGHALHEVVRRLPDRPFVLVGHSMGAMSALAFARLYPRLFHDRVSGLVLLSTTAKAGAEDVAMGMGIQALVRIQNRVESVAGIMGQRARRLAHLYRASSDLSFLLTRTVGLARDADPRHVDLTEQLVIDTDISTIAALTPVLLTMDEDDTLADIDVPTVVVVGSGDRITPVGHAEHIARVNEDVDLLELSGIGHMTPLEAADVVNALIVRMAATAGGTAA